jgi:16S rRNA (adenine1518-N6/adenine1519-N6)-dimethyltransferase
MVEILATTCIECRNVQIIQKDIRDFLPQGIGPYKVVANLPYYLTSFVIRKFLEERNKPQTMTVLVQREVAEKICAKPGRMSLNPLGYNSTEPLS